MFRRQRHRKSRQAQCAPESAVHSCWTTPRPVYDHPHAASAVYCAHLRPDRPVSSFADSRDKLHSSPLANNVFCSAVKASFFSPKTMSRLSIRLTPRSRSLTDASNGRSSFFASAAHAAKWNLSVWQSTPSKSKIYAVNLLIILANAGAESAPARPFRIVFHIRFG